MVDQAQIKKRSSSVAKLLICVGLGAVFVPPTVIILGVGMVPTFVARFANPNRVRGTVAAMAAFNLAGIVPVLGILYDRGHTIEQAFRLLSDVYMWLMMYGGAGMAAFLLWGVPLVVQGGYEMQARQYIKRLEKRRSRMIEEWGGQIVADAKILPANPDAPAAKGTPDK
ncbi:hypothetical protein [Sneathiella glossodoripedis]|uniref:hypothetical protein n=1 Tax=Sneathiella glossodoripedis TaxID=418853 RepID=UPI00046EE30F|nr:hypothetical protein [Sneathiella glossodoripedis]